MSMTSPAGRRTGGSVELVGLDLPQGLFTSEWRHCSAVSSYLADVVAQHRDDPMYFRNLFSSAANELFETLFRLAAPEGLIRCTVGTLDGAEIIRLEADCGEAGAALVETIRASLASAEPDALYLSALLSTGPLDLATGLLELVVDFNATVTLERLDSRRVRIEAILDLEGTA